ncbi:hypothetical protein DPMN_093639 [Dreissena polymorpha]|uniref:Uncharacterized protein n=1 Tax=Dreissena polymorpha TaxID=45954 RepID=A0A9D4R1X0_DREPO|nr:hypothetical protein DPMN_093639 [Dreissena polymorpha]
MVSFEELTNGNILSAMLKAYAIWLARPNHGLCFAVLGSPGMLEGIFYTALRCLALSQIQRARRCPQRI